MKIFLNLVIMLKILFVSLTTLLLCISCVPSRPFVGSSFEPIVTKEKGDAQCNLSFRPFKYCYLTGAYAINNYMAVKVGVGGFVNLLNLDAGLIFFKNSRDVGIFAAPVLNYQNNHINSAYSLGAMFGTRRYRYVCEYISPGAVLGLNIFANNARQHQLVLKYSYNMVTVYTYRFYSDNASGKDSGFRVVDNETLNTKIPNFMNFETGYSFLERLTDEKYFKFQVTLNFAMKPFAHTYSFESSRYNRTTVTATRLHPRVFPLNISFGYVFTSHKRKK